MSTTWMIGPAGIVSLYDGVFFRRTASSEGTTIAAIYEKPGLVDRRGAVGHEFTEDQVAFARQVLYAQGHLDDVTFEENLPKDWRPDDLLGGV